MTTIAEGATREELAAEELRIGRQIVALQDRLAWLRTSHTHKLPPGKTCEDCTRVATNIAAAEAERERLTAERAEIEKRKLRS